MARAKKDKTSSEDGGADEAGPTSIVRISRELHHGLRILSAYEGKSIRELLDEMIENQIAARFAERKIKFSARK